MPVLYFEQTLWRRLSSFSVDINPIHFHFKERSANFENFFKNSLFNSEAIKHFRYLHLRFVVGYRTLVLKTPYLNIITVGNSYFYFAYFRTFSLQ